MYAIQYGLVDKKDWITFPESDMYEEIRVLVTANCPHRWDKYDINEETEDLVKELKKKGSVEINGTRIVKIK